MLRKISELNLDAVIARIQHGVDCRTRQISEPILQRDVDALGSPGDAIEMLRDHITLAISRRLSSSEIRFAHPLVQALVRCQHHPNARPIPVAGSLTPEAGAQLNRLVAAHPELQWSPDAVQDLLIQAIRLYGEHELEDDQRPGLMYWGPASPAATALIVLVALRKLGDL